MSRSIPNWVLKTNTHIANYRSGSMVSKNKPTPKLIYFVIIFTVGAAACIPLYLYCYARQVTQGSWALLWENMFFLPQLEYY